MVEGRAVRKEELMVGERVSKRQTETKKRRATETENGKGGQGYIERVTKGQQTRAMILRRGRRVREGKREKDKKKKTG